MEHNWDETAIKLIVKFREDVISIFLNAHSDLQEQLAGMLVPPPQTVYKIIMQEDGQELVVTFIGESIMMDAHAVVYYQGARWEISIGESGEINGDPIITQVL